MPGIETFKERLQTLVAKFQKDSHHYLSRGYLEAQVRIDFINPFFDALGWDIENRAQRPPHERDVVVELSPEATGRPDYNFRLNGVTKFFVEAKAPSVALNDTNHILQAKTYAWSTKEVYFVVLTDFEEFRLYDASLRPNPKYPNEGLIFALKYTDYVQNIDKLWELSRERVEQGSLEALLPKDTKSKRLRIPPDKSFLEDLTQWRTELAKDIYKRNPELNTKLLNDVVQRLLDRIVFIRIAEDRKIRPDRELWEIVAQWKEEGRRRPIITHLKDLFKEINDDLNGDIFKPHACECVDVSSERLAEIIEGLYFPKSRYRFDAIGVELLGSIYERYLGSTIRVTPQRVKVEEKPEVRKAGGVYYTPKYIVDYIVKNTVGRVIEGKTPRQIEKIKVLDPACGSGSFLLGAYQYLIDYHIKYYREHRKEAQSLHLFPYWDFSPEEFALPIHEKAKILRNNIFGVDIDPQAVEITMMSLYLKALEGERGLLPRKQHLLPPLSNNIKCGNSLIGYDILEEMELDDETKARINPFDWHSKTAGFGEIMESGGFDVVIGNPPYVRIQAMKEWAPVEVEYYKKSYASASKGNYDIYVVFVEKGFSLLKTNGYLGYILPHKFFQAQYGEPLRKLLTDSKALSEIVDFTTNQIFENATTYTCLLFLANKVNKEFKYLKFDLKDEVSLDQIKDFDVIKSSKITSGAWNFHPSAAGVIIEKINLIQTKLSHITKKIFKGSSTGNDKVYLLKLIQEKQETCIVFSQQLNKEIELEKMILKPFLFGSDIKRYGEPQTQIRILFPYEKVGGSVNLIPLGKLKSEYPSSFGYLSLVKSILMNRKIDLKTNDFYKYSAARSLIEYNQTKIMIPDILVENRITIDLKGSFYHGPAIHSIVFNEKVNNYNSLFFLGIFNSKLFWFYLTQTSTALSGNAYRLIPQFLDPFPIKLIDLSNPAEKAIHDRLVALVDRMLDLHKKKAALPPSAERERIEREIAVTDEKIDEIVYGLYGITEEERRVIEGRQVL